MCAVTTEASVYSRYCAGGKGVSKVALTITIPAELLEEVKERAKKDNVRKSTVVIRAVRQYLREVVE